VGGGLQAAAHRHAWRLATRLGCRAVVRVAGVCAVTVGGVARTRAAEDLVSDTASPETVSTAAPPLTMSVPSSPQSESIPFDGTTLSVDYRLATWAGKTRIYHRMVVEGPNDQLIGQQMAPSVEQRIPSILRGLVRLAESPSLTD